MSILVTGATGFIGTHLVKLLARRGETVRILCRPSSDVSILNKTNIQICRGDLLDSSSIESALQGCKRLFHLAAYARVWAKNPQIFLETNVRGMKNVLEAALKSGVGRVVLTSTSVTLGPSENQAVNETTERKADFFTEYERSKFIAEQEALQYVAKGLDLVIVNPSRVFGPGLLNESNSVTKMIYLYLTGKWRWILGNGKRVGNYAFVNDVVQGHLLAMEAGRTGEKYILGGENVSYNDFFQILSNFSSRKYKLFHIPSALALTFAEFEKLKAAWFGKTPLITPGWIKTFLVNWAFSSAKAQSQLGYTITPLSLALETTVTWLKERIDKI